MFGIKRVGKSVIATFLMSCFLVVGTLTASVSSAAAQSVIREIVVKGNQRVEPETIESYMRLSRGDKYDSARINDSLKSLFRTGLFSDVRIEKVSNGVLVINVVENPIINQISFEGNKELKDEDLGKEVELRPRVVFTRARVQNDAARIVELYRRAGRFAASVEPKIIERSQNRVDLIFEINEGPVTKVSRINFIGNRAFSDSQLRSVVSTEESAWYKFFSSSDNYDPDRLAFDKELLRRHYLKNGYVDFQVLSAVAELARDGKSFFITITVEEGDEYKFGPSDVDSRVAELDPERLRSKIKTTENETYNAGLVDETVESLTVEAGKEGFAFARVRPRVDKNTDEKTVSLTFAVEEGPRVYIDRIDIVGNSRTLDRVIRREIRLVEGDAYNRFLVDKARRRITALGFFSKVDIKQSPGSSADRVNLTIYVVEKSTGQFSVGAGFSSSEAIIGDLSITERNLMGRGQFLRLRTSLSFKRQQVDIRFTEPYFLGRKMSFGIDIFGSDTNQQDESSFSARTTGAGLRFGFPISEDVTLSTRYNFTRTRIRNVDASASPAIQGSAGTANTSLVGFTLTYNTLDNPFEPTTGIRLSLNQDLAGIGGDVYYSRTVAQGSYYYPLYKKQIIASLFASGGFITGWNGKQVRIVDSFFKGSETFRGFKRSGIGPREAGAGLNDDSLGGKIFAIGTAEVSFPVGLPETWGVRGAVFTDVGTLYDAPTPGTATILQGDKASLRATVGASLLYKSPLGPLRFDFSLPVKKESFDKTEFFRFSAGTSF